MTISATMLPTTIPAIFNARMSAPLVSKVTSYGSLTAGMRHWFTTVSVSDGVARRQLRPSPENPMGQAGFLVPCRYR